MIPDLSGSVGVSLREGTLWVEDCPAPELAARFGTPLYVVSEAQLRANARRFLAAFGDRWPHGPVRVLPSIKANLSLALRRVLSEEGMGCDTFGAGELHAALQGGVDPERISVNGAVKDAELVARAVELGARITLDHPRELPIVAAAARRLGRQARIRLRARLDLDLAVPSDFFDEPLGDATRRYKSGMSWDELIACGRDTLAAPELELTGLMVHLGRHSARLEVWRAMAAAYAELLGRAIAAWGTWRPQEIDLGGGFPLRRDPLAHRTAGGREPAPAPALEELADAILSTLSSALRRRGIATDGVALEVEPGRAMYGDAGVHLATVRNVKHQGEQGGRTWVETDTSEMFLLDVALEGARWPTLLAGRAGEPPTQTVDVVGRSCTFDVIAGAVRLPPAREGDVVAFLDTGAYQDACATNFNAMTRPATVLVDGVTAEVVKRAETIDDVFRRDIIPDRLRHATLI
jgi:diaminopimelate decarboxylase